MDFYLILLIAYLVIGGVVGAALMVWGAGMRGIFEGKDLLIGLFALFFWLPYIIWKVVKVALIVLLPVRWTRNF